jgi:hypothetical protein
MRQITITISATTTMISSWTKDGIASDDSDQETVCHTVYSNFARTQISFCQICATRSSVPD